MEAIAANLILFIVLIWNGEEIGLRRHGGMEGIIKHDHFRHLIPKDGPARIDALNVSRIVERCQIAELFDPFQT